MQNRGNLPKSPPWTEVEDAAAKLTLIDTHLLNLANAIAQLHNDIAGLGLKGLPTEVSVSLTGLLSGIPQPTPFPAPLIMPVDDGGVASSGTENTLTDTTKYWDIGALAGSVVWLVIDKQLYRMVIVSNTLQEFTFSPSLPRGIMPDKGTPYFIKQSLTSSQLLSVIELFLTKAATPILTKPSLAASTTTTLTDCTAINLMVAKTGLAIIVACTFDGAATAGIRVHVRSSYDGTNYDTQDFDSWIPNFTAGATIQATKVYNTSVGYLKVLIENMDAAKAVANISVKALIQGPP
jgi:hypothetical protein